MPKTLITTGWAKAALATWLIFSSSLAAHATPVGDFLGIVKGGWLVQIGQRADQLRIAETANVNNFVDIAVTDGSVQPAEVWKAVKFLSNIAAKPSSARETALLLEAMPFDAQRASALPQGLRYTQQPDGGVAIQDNRGAELGYIDKGSSRADAADSVVSGMASRAADGLISSTSKMLPASSAYMDETAAFSSAEIDDLLAEIKRMPDGQSPRGNASASEIAKMKADQTAARQRQLYFDVNDALASKNVITERLFAANELKAICDKNKLAFKFEADPRSQKITGFRIQDPNNNNAILAAGQLRTGMGDGVYVPLRELRNLRDQLAQEIGPEPQLLNDVENIDSEDIRWAQSVDEEVEKYARDHSKPEDPNKDPKKDPKKDPNGDPDGPGGKK